MADETVSIRIRLSGGREAAAEARLVKGAVGGIGDATTRSARVSERAGSRIHGVLTRLRGAWSSVLRVAKWAAAGMAAGAVGVALWGKNAVNATAELAKGTAGLNKTFGLTVENASALLSLGKVRGAEVTKMNMAIKALATNTRGAASGSKAAVEMFDKLGISQADIQRGMKDTNWWLFRVSKGFHDLPAGVDRAAIAGKLFGRGWQSVFALFREGPRELRRQINLAKEYGAVLHGKTLRSTMDYVEAQREMQLANIGLQITFTENVLPSLIKVFRWFGRLTKQYREGKGPLHVISVGFAALVTGIKWTVIGVKWTIAAVKEMVQWIKGAAEWVSRAGHNFIGFVTSLLPVRLAVFLVIVAFNRIVAVLRGPVRVAWAVVRMAVRLTWIIIRTFARVVADVIAIVSNLLRGNFAGAWRAAKRLVGDAIGGIRAILGTLIGFLRRVPGIIWAAMKDVGRAIAAPFIWAWHKLVWVYNKIKGVIDKIKGAVGAVGHAGKTIVGSVGEFLGFQHGVRNFGGGWALVGEAGPELVNLPRGSDVIPRRETQRVLFERPIGGHSIEVRQPIQLRVGPRLLAETVVTVQSDERARE